LTDSEWVSLLGYVPSLKCDRCIYSEDFGLLEIDSDNEDIVNFDVMSEIPVPQFIDLMTDSIPQWRLDADNYNPYNLCRAVDVYIDNGVVWMHHKEGSERMNTNVKTYTDLISLVDLFK